MMNIFLSAPITILPLNTHYVHWDSFSKPIMKKGRLWALVAVTHVKCQTSLRSIFSVLSSDMFHLAGGGHIMWWLHLCILLFKNFNTICHFKVYSGRRSVLFFLPLTCGSCYYLMCHSFVKGFTKNQPQTNKWPKSFHVFMTKKGSAPFVYRTMHKKQLIRSVRLLNSAGGVYFVIAAVPMSL